MKDSPHNWSVTSTGGRFQYVLAYARSPQGRKRSITLARLVAQAGKGQRVTYLDGDRLNLRGKNLALEKGGGNAATPARAIRPRKEVTQESTRLMETQRTPAASAEPRRPFTPRVVDVAAQGQRARQKIAAQAVEVTA